MSFNTITRTFTDLPSTQINCWCGVAFAVPRSLYNHYVDANDRRAGSYELHCPLGHSMIPAGQSEAAKLRDQLASKEREVLAAKSRADKETERRRDAEAETRRQARKVSARKGVATRLKRKIAAGRCPCCSHEFKNLKQHMKVQHPKWDLEKHAAALEAKENG